jgi:LAO/AO transport system kinase
MLRMRSVDAPERPGRGHHGPTAGSDADGPSGSVDADGPAGSADAADRDDANGPDGDRTDDGNDESWTPPVIETVATSGDGVEDLLAALDDHGAYLDRTGERRERARSRYAEAIRRLLRTDAGELLEEELDRCGGIEELAEAVLDRETDPYTVADEVLEPLADCVRERRDG